MYTDRGPDSRPMSDFHINRILIEAEAVTSCAISGSDVLELPGVPLDGAVEITAVADNRAVYLLDPGLVEKTFPLGEKGVPTKGLWNPLMLS